MIPMLGDWHGKKAGVYQICHQKSGKVYIGSTLSLSKRLRQHRSDLRCNNHANRLLQRAWNKHGEKDFFFKVLIVCTPDMRVFYEQIFIDGLQSADPCKGYNLSKSAEIRSGDTVSNEARRKMSAFHRGKVLTEEHKRRIGEYHKGRPKTLEHRQKIGMAHKGRSPSESAKLAMSIAHKGKRNPTMGQNMRDKKECPQGHLYDGKNLILEKTKTGVARRCRICSIQKAIRHKKKKERCHEIAA